jgi:transketolase
MNNLSLEAKYKAFGWDVLKMEGNDMQSVIDTIQLAKSRLGKGSPVIVMMKTEMGAGVDFMMGSHKWHGVAPNDQQLSDALAQLEETLGDY